MLLVCLSGEGLPSLPGGVLKGEIPSSRFPTLIGARPALPSVCGVSLGGIFGLSALLTGGGTEGLLLFAIIDSCDALGANDGASLAPVN